MAAQVAPDSVKCDSAGGQHIVPLFTGNSPWTGKRTILNRHNHVVVTPEQLLAGQMAGVRVAEMNGGPGGDFSVAIRGVATFSGSNEPLYVIDGLPLVTHNSDYGHRVFSDSRPYAPNVLTIINPSDIESVEIIKNGSAIAAYGSRAAYGVVLIRTKRARAGKLNIDFESSASVHSKKRLPNVLSAEDFVAFVKRSAKNYPLMYGRIDSLLENPAFSYRNVNRVDEVTQKGTTFQQQLGLSGGFKFLRFSLRGNLSDQKGIVKHSRFDRKSILLNLDFTFLKGKLLLGTSTYYASAQSEIRELDANLYGAAPITPVYVKDSSILAGIGWIFEIRNPLDRVRASGAEVNIKRLISTQYAKIEILKDLSLRVQYGLSTNKQDYNLPNFSASSVSKSVVDHSQRLFETALSYGYAWKKSNWAISAGYSEQELEKIAGAAQGNDRQAIDHLLNGVRKNHYQLSEMPQGIQSFQSMRNRARIKSYVIQSSLLSGSWEYYANVRKDSWEKAFNSAGGGIAWRVPDKKRRLEGQGISLMRVVADYGYVSSIYSPWIPDVTRAVFFGGKKINRQLMSLGGELELKDSKLQVEADYFYQITNNPVFSRTVEVGSNQQPLLQQIKRIDSRGFEISAKSTVVRKKNLAWILAGSFTAMKNRTKDQERTLPLKITDGWTDNKPVGSIFTSKNNGVWNSPEEIRNAGKAAADVPGLLGAERRDDLSAQWLGSALPNVIWGFSSTLLWRKFDMSVVVRGEHGQLLLNGAAMDLHSGFFTNTTYFTVEKAWAPDRPENNMPRQTSYSIFSNSSWYWEKAGFARLQHVSAGYTVRAFKDSNLRVFLSAQNLLLLTKYTGGDPETSFYGQDMSKQGFDYGTYPRASTVSLGIQFRY